jgi:hypothetical protein
VTDRGADDPETAFGPARYGLVALNRQEHDTIVTFRLSDGRIIGDLSARGRIRLSAPPPTTPAPRPLARGR